MATMQNATFPSPLADGKYAQIGGNSQIEALLSSISGFSGWTIAFTLFAMVVAYDQSKDFQIAEPNHSLTISQSVTSGRRVPLKDRRGSCPLWVHFWNPWILNSKNTWGNGPVDHSVVCPCSTSTFITIGISPNEAIGRNEGLTTLQIRRNCFNPRYG